MTIHDFSSLSKNLDKWFFWASDRKKHYNHIRTNAYKILSEQNMLIQNPSREQLELEMKFFKKLKSKIGSIANVDKVDSELTQVEKEIADYDLKVSKFVDKAGAASIEDYMLMLQRPEAYLPDKRVLEDRLISVQTEILDLLLNPGSLKDLASYTRQRNAAIGKLQSCKRFTQNLASLEQKLTFDSLASMRSRNRFPGFSCVRQLFVSGGSAISSISSSIGDFAFYPEGGVPIRALVATVGLAAGLGAAVAYNKISFDQIKTIGVLSGMVAWGYFSKHLESLEQV